MTGEAIPQSNAKVVRYYHGGNRGLKVGQCILPASETGKESASDFGAGKLHRKDRVYVSVALEHAQFFASGSKTPVVYEVEPEGEIEPDPDCKTGVSFACQKAKVVGVHNIRGKTVKKFKKMMVAQSHARRKMA
ncbi:NAD(+)--rifampin ADP-ribosyltransferase [Bradyrhizobium diazoefficiens]|nr:NAD(+)--rifampin ADP-ribosyltransferase [Bradyrhizobium diazoefficiens]QQN66749.1 NAD(+)--rifampin ADP-ribosyltransferase [Bradyrhizobium diazoefficiens]